MKEVGALTDDPEQDMEDGGEDVFTLDNGKKSPTRLSRCLMRLAEYWLMAIKTEDSTVLRMEMVCVFEGRDSLCETYAEETSTIGALEAARGIGHSPPS